MIILIDNYDSFTWNLYHFLGDLGQKVKVFRNDKVGIDKLIGLKPKAFVISPGPGEPTSAGISVDLVRRCVDSKIPLLGVCLCLLYTSPSPRDAHESRMPSSA